MSIDERVGKWALGLMGTAVMALAGFLWNMNAEIAVMKSEMLRDKNSKETADEVLKNWSKMNSRMEAIERQMRSIWEKYNKALEQKEAATERVAKLEAKLEYCCE